MDKYCKAAQEQESDSSSKGLTELWCPSEILKMLPNTKEKREFDRRIDFIPPLHPARGTQPLLAPPECSDLWIWQKNSSKDLCWERQRCHGKLNKLCSALYPWCSLFLQAYLAVYTTGSSSKICPRCSLDLQDFLLQLQAGIFWWGPRNWISLSLYSHIFSMYNCLELHLMLIQRHEAMSSTRNCKQL